MYHWGSGDSDPTAHGGPTLSYDDGQYSDRLGGYVDVAARMAEFRAKYPNGGLRPADITTPYKIETVGDRTFIVVVAAAFRSPDDPIPGIGMAWEQFPGRTPYTRDSELQNAETSAWGRAIVATLAADTKKIASAEEVRNRMADRDEDQRDHEAEREAARANWMSNCKTAIAAASSTDELDDIARRIGNAQGKPLTSTDSIELRRLVVARRDALPAAEPSNGRPTVEEVREMDGPASTDVDAYAS